MNTIKAFAEVQGDDSSSEVERLTMYQLTFQAALVFQTADHARLLVEPRRLTEHIHEFLDLLRVLSQFRIQRISNVYSLAL